MTREDWLFQFTQAARPIFASAGFPLPEIIRASIGFCSTGRKSKRIGECWQSEASADGAFEIFIVPQLQSDSSRIADILTHELCHAATPGAKHGKVFKQCATALGLEGKMTATTAGASWHAWADAVLATLGPLPGADLADGTPPRKVQTTRMLKAQCGDCSLTFRLSRAWAERATRCPDAQCGGIVKLT